MALIAEAFRQWVQESLGDESAAALACMQTPLRKSLRINTLRDDGTLTRELMANVCSTFTPLPWCRDGFWVNSKYPEQEFSFGLTLEHQAGAIYLQEASSMLPPLALAHTLQQQRAADDTDHNGALILDMCAAPGSKTTQLAAQFPAPSFIVANEMSASRLKTLAASLTRCAVANVALTHQDGRVFGERCPEMFDAILLDAPCTGEGTVRKDPDALKVWDRNAIAQTAQLQRELFASAYAALKPGGVLVYSTCTLNTEENHSVCRWALEQFGGALQTFPLQHLFPEAARVSTPEGWLWVWPQRFDSEGFFVAAFVKKAPAVNTSSSGSAKQGLPALRNFQPLTRKERERVLAHFRSALQVDADTFIDHCYQRDQTVWWIAPAVNRLAEGLPFNRYGLPIAQLQKDEVRCEQGVVALFGQQLLAHALPLTRAQAIEYFKGRDIADYAAGKGERVVQFAGLPLGLIKALPNRLKNSYPREFVVDKLY